MIDRKTSLCFSMTALAVTGLLIAACDSADDGSAHLTPPPPAAESPPPAADSPPPAADGAPPAAMGTSSVTGKVVFDGQAPRLKPVAMSADPGCEAKHEGPVAAQSLVLGEGQSLGNVFVQVKNPPAGSYPAPAEPAVIDQNGCLYQPRVIGMQVGQTLRFLNSDGILHNVHGLAKVNREFNIGMPPSLREKDTTFNKPEPLFPVKCDVHPWMRTYVAVMTHPFYAVTGESGEFRVEGLPAGSYEIEAWHEKLGTHSASVTVADGETGAADFTFTLPSKG